MKTVACYCRVSTEEQVKYGFSIQAQKDALTNYCKENDYKYDVYIDEGISASSMKKRKALQEMLEKSVAYDMILFTKLDRLSRNVLDANNINKILQDNHCTMKAIDEDDVDTSTADGMFMFNLKVSLAQREIGKTSERIRFVFKNKREKGEVTSGTPKYGYKIKDKKFVIDSEEAENIRNLYKYFISVNGDHKKTYSYFVKHFPGKGKDALFNYLRETAYIGKYKLYRKNVYLDNYIPPIMDKELFNEVQNLLPRVEKVLKKENIPSIFAGMLYCYYCKSRLVRKVDYRSKNKIINYFCDKQYKYKVGINEKQCQNSKVISDKSVEEYLINNLKYLCKPYISKSIIKTKPKPQKNNIKINSLKNKLSKLKDLYLDDLISKEDYKQDYIKINKEILKLEEEQKEKPQKDFTYLNELINKDIPDIYNTFNIDEKRKIWLKIIDKIYVKDGKIKEVTFL
ncbi:MAG: recombinase family protein [Clostridia bacterium]